MKKHLSIYIIAACLALFTSACISKPGLPSNPKDKQEHKDEKGNRWVYNAASSCWMVYPLIAGSNYTSSTPYQYYPGSGTWKTASGVVTNPPASIPKSAYSPSSKPNSSSNYSSSYSRKSSSGSSYSNSRSSTSSGKSFGTSVSSRSSVGAKKKMAYGKKDDITARRLSPKD